MLIGSYSILFRHPCGPEATPRTAVLLPGFRKRQGKVRSIVMKDGNEDAWLDELSKFAPQSLAGSVEQLLYLANWRDALTTPPDHSLVVIFKAEQPWLTEHERDVLWGVYGLPVYEQLYGASGLLASECEAHDGLHTLKDADWTVGRDRELWYYEPIRWWEDRNRSYFPSGLFGAIDREPCPCGRKSARLRVALPVTS